MRTSTTLVLLLAISAASLASFNGKNVKQTDVFGREFTMMTGSGYSHTIVQTDRKEHLFHPDLALQNYKDFTATLQDKQAFVPRESTITECQPGNPDFFKMLATTVAALKSVPDTTHITSFCYERIVFQMDELEDGTSTTSITAFGKKQLTCTESYLVSTGKHFHLFTLPTTGIYRYTFTGLDEEEMNYIALKGVSFMRFCDSIFHFIPSLLKTAQLFIGGLGLSPTVPFFGSHVPIEMQKANVQFIKEATGYEWRERPSNKYIQYDAKHFQSGDFLAITRFDGIDNIIHWGAGSHSGHSVMALWDNSVKPAQLYIVESQDGWYWPNHGLQRTKWEQWRTWAHNADFNIAHLPLKRHLAEKFDEKKAWAWFDETKGMPYGYRNFLFGWIDTPFQNFPSVLDMNFAYLVFRLLEKINHAITDQLLKEALNWRVGGKDLDLWEIEQKALSQGKTINDLFAMVEPEGIKYSDGYSYVCSAYVMSFYYRSGMLGDIVGEATEFTPRDVYTLDVFEKDWKKPQECHDNDPELPYCQIMGRWKMDLPGYNSIPPYSHMAERCPSQAPDYFRPHGC